jgi:DNA-nicking Smr family endonuclease
MSRKPGGRPQDATRRLSEEDARLWRQMQERVEPLRKKRDRVSASAGAGADAARPEGTKPANDARPSGAARHRPPKSVAGAPAGKPKKVAAPPPLAELGKRMQRKLGSGRTPIGGVIDLHGLRRSEARAALRAFLLAAQADGHKFVKVITGKGGKSDSDQPKSFFEDDNPRGVLRREVPEWLAAAEFRLIVVGFSAAARSHGGDGALYVELRRRQGEE